MTLRILLAAAACALAVPAAAPRAQGLPIQVRQSTGTFLYDDAQSLVEVYLSFGASSLRYRPSETGGFAADLALTVALRRAASAAPAGTERPPVFEQRYERRFVVSDTAALASGQVFVELVRAAVPPGEYEVVTTVEGGPGERWSEFSLVSDVTVPAYGARAMPAVSSLELATVVERATGTPDPFTRSGLRIVPNPDAFYGAGLPDVRFYAEVYNPPGDSLYTLLSFLTSSESASPLPGTEQRTARRARPVDVVVGQHDVSALPSGVYTLRVVALDASNEAVAEQASRFFVVNPGVARPEVASSELSFEESLYAVMGEEELELNLAHARVIASGRDQQLIDRLTSVDDQRAFLVRFWTERDPSPSRSSNEARRAYYERLGTVDQRFTHAGTPGFRTDRGRVFLTYGSPSQTERREFDANSPPYELWMYDNIPGEGQSLFVFMDRFGTGQYEIIHSDVTGEVSMPGWQNQLNSFNR